MSQDYIQFVGWALLIIHTIGLLGGPFLFGEEREPYNAKTWLIKMIFFILFYLPVFLFIINN